MQFLKSDLLTELFFIGLAELMARANIAEQGLSQVGFGLLMAAYLAAIFALVGWLLWKYRLPKDFRHGGVGR